MDKKELATKIFKDLVDDYFLAELVEHQEEIIESIEGRLSTYLIIDGGNILRGEGGEVRR